MTKHDIDTCTRYKITVLSHQSIVNTEGISLIMKSSHGWIVPKTISH